MTNEVKIESGEIVSVPSKLDILCGRGLASFNHEGNVQFRFIIASNIAKYRAASRKPEKTTIVRKIVDDIHESGGRFLRRLPQKRTNVIPYKESAGGKERPGSSWVVLGTKQAREKVGHALRDACTDKIKCMTKATGIIKKFGSDAAQGNPMVFHELRLMCKTHLKRKKRKVDREKSVHEAFVETTAVAACRVGSESNKGQHEFKEINTLWQLLEEEAMKPSFRTDESNPSCPESDHIGEQADGSLEKNSATQSQTTIEVVGRRLSKTGMSTIPCSMLALFEDDEVRGLESFSMLDSVTSQKTENLKDLLTLTADIKEPPLEFLGSELVDELLGIKASTSERMVAGAPSSLIQLPHSLSLDTEALGDIFSWFCDKIQTNETHRCPLSPSKILLA